MFTANLLTDAVSILIAEIPDIVLLIAVLIVGIIQAKRGFFACVFSLIGTIASIAISIVVTPYIVTWLENTWGFTTTVSGWVEGIISDWQGFDVVIGTAGTELTESDITTALAGAGIPGFIVTVVVKLLPTVDFAGKTIAQIVSPVWGGYIVSGICYVVVFLVAQLIFWIIGKLISKLLTAISPVKFINGLLGFVVGLVEVAIVTYGILFVATFVPWQEVQTYLQGSWVVGYMYDHNLLAMLLGKVLSGDWFAGLYTMLFPTVA